MAMSDRDKKQMTALAGVLAIAGAAAFWFFIHQPNAVKIGEMRVRIDSLSRQVDSARRDLARGSVESLRQRVQDYQRAVQLMRRLVPAASEVPNLIDNVSLRAKVRGVSIAQFTPLPVEGGSPFQTHRYRFSVIGHFDQIGELLSDVGSLARIMVPYDVSLAPLQASAASKAAFGEAAATMLEATFQLRTFVKAAAAPDSTGGVE